MPIDKCKLPAYVASDPLTWFRAVEACFQIHQVRKDTDRAALLIAALPAKQLQQVSAILAVTTSDQYESLKRRLISTDAPSFQENWEKCMSLPPLRPGDKPSDLYSALTSWLKDDQDPDNPWVKATFISKLPEELRIMLLAHPEYSLEKMSTFADTLALGAKRRSSPQVFSMVVDQDLDVSPSTSPPSPPPVLGVRATKQDKNPPPSSLCWFHQRFGDKAKSCKPGCAKASLNSSRPGQ